MIAAFGDLFLGVLIAVGLLCCFVAALAVHDCIARGDRKIRDAFEEMERWESARQITGRTDW